MGAPSEIRNLMDRFRERAEAYRSSSYNETQVRREFVDPFFHALGWDVDNERSYAEAYKEVVHEDREIDGLVYELYDVTDEEIRIVEEATAR